MRGDSNSRARYLSLALVSRKTINDLTAVAAGGPVDTDLNESLNRLLIGTSLQTSPNFVSHLEASGAWTHFEDLSTVDELKEETGTDLGRVVTSVLNNDDNVDSRSQNAKQLISFLTAVEGRALQRYTDSMEVQLI